MSSLEEIGAELVANMHRFTLNDIRAYKLIVAYTIQKCSACAEKRKSSYSLIYFTEL